MNHSWKKHYQEKFPGGRVSLGENSFDVYCKNGHHQVRMEKSGAGIWQDRSEEYGCKHSHDGQSVELKAVEEVEAEEAPKKSKK